MQCDHGREFDGGYRLGGGGCQGEAVLVLIQGHEGVMLLGRGIGGVTAGQSSVTVLRGVDRLR